MGTIRFMDYRKQAGFTLVEILIAAACGVLLLAVLVSTARSMAGWSDRVSQRADAEAELDRLTDRWYADSATAWSVFTPANDVFGKPNSDGHEFDMVTEDAQHRASYKAYYYDTMGKRLLEYTYGSPSATPIATGDESDNLTSFTAQTYDASSLQNPTSPAYDPLYTTATITNADVPLNLGTNAIGGNPITQICITTQNLTRTVKLASGTAPSSVTVVLTYTPSP